MLFMYNSFIYNYGTRNPSAKYGGFLAKTTLWIGNDRVHIQTMQWGKQEQVESFVYGIFEYQ